jgi:hypothetical protein
MVPGVSIFKYQRGHDLDLQAYGELGDSRLMLTESLHFCYHVSRLGGAWPGSMDSWLSYFLIDLGHVTSKGFPASLVTRENSSTQGLEPPQACFLPGKGPRLWPLASLLFQGGQGFPRQRSRAQR